MVTRLLLLSLLFLGSSIYSSQQSDYASLREVPILENEEPLIDLQKQAIIAYDLAESLKNPECTQVRQAVYEKLCAAQKLLPHGLKFQLISGLRTLTVQARLFDQQQEKLKKQFPEMNERELFLETSKFVAPIKTWEGNVNVPPHSTGGTIAIVLLNQEGKRIDMGIDFENPFQNEKAMHMEAPSISVEARNNREIMRKALLATGFVNYPGAFWHWSYGDRRWAFLTHAKHSIYGPITHSNTN